MIRTPSNLPPPVRNALLVRASEHPTVALARGVKRWFRCCCGRHLGGAVLLVLAILAVKITIAYPRLVDAPVSRRATGELGVEAGVVGAVYFIRVVSAITFTIAFPRTRDALDAARGTSEFTT